MVAACRKARSDFAPLDDLKWENKELHFHGFRSAMVTRLRGAHVRSTAVAKVTGHKSDAMVDRHDQPVEDQTVAEMARVS